MIQIVHEFVGSDKRGSTVVLYYAATIVMCTKKFQFFAHFALLKHVMRKVSLS